MTAKMSKLCSSETRNKRHNNDLNISHMSVILAESSCFPPPHAAAPCDDLEGQ